MASPIRCVSCRYITGARRYHCCVQSCTDKLHGWYGEGNKKSIRQVFQPTMGLYFTTFYMVFFIEGARWLGQIACIVRISIILLPWHAEGMYM